MVKRLPTVALGILLHPSGILMSRVEDALNRARYLRSIFEKERTDGTPDADSHDNGINVLVISDDLPIA
jgi:hypothetical protein